MLDLTLDPRSGVPLGQQIAAQIRRAVAAGRLRPGDRLPTVRELAEALLVNPNTVAKVYRELEAAGLLDTRGAAGTFVAAGAAAMAAAERRRIVAQALHAVVQEARELGVGVEELTEMLRAEVGGSTRLREAGERGAPHPNPLPGGEGGEGAGSRQRSAEQGAPHPDPLPGGEG